MLGKIVPPARLCAHLISDLFVSPSLKEELHDLLVPSACRPMERSVALLGEANRQLTRHHDIVHLD